MRLIILLHCYIILSLFFVPMPIRCNEADNYARKIETAITENNFSEAIALLNRILAKNPTDPLLLQQLGRCHEGLQQYDMAVHSYFAAHQKLQYDADIHTAIARCYYQLGSHDTDAISYLDTALEIQNKSPQTYYWRALCYARTGNTHAAQTDFSRAIELSPQFTGAYLARGAFFESTGHLDHALADYTAILAYDPHHPDALLNRARIYQKQNNFELALTDLTTLITHHPDNTSALLERASLFAKHQYYQHAIADYSLALTLNPSLTQGFVQRGQLYQRRRQYAQACADFSQAIALNPHLATVYLNRADCYRRMNQYKNAYNDYTALLALRPDTTLHTYILRGDTAFALQDYTRAINDYTAASHDTAQNASLLIKLARAHSLNGDYREAIQRYEQAITLKPQTVDYYVELGKLYMDNGSLSNARRYYQKALELDYWHPLANTYTALLLTAIDSPVLAEEYFNNALLLDPVFTPAYFYRAIAFIDRYDAQKTVMDLLHASFAAHSTHRQRP